MKTLMIYGASGYTGRMAAAHAKEAGLTLVLAGRDEASIRLRVRRQRRLRRTNLGPDFSGRSRARSGSRFGSSLKILRYAGWAWYRLSTPSLRWCTSAFWCRR